MFLVSFLYRFLVKTLSINKVTRETRVNISGLDPAFENENAVKFEKIWRMRRGCECSGQSPRAMDRPGTRFHHRIVKRTNCNSISAINARRQKFLS